MHKSLNRHKISLVVCIALAIIAILNIIACGDQETSAQAVNVDLISIFDIAKTVKETGEVDLSSPIRYYALAKGWSFPHPNPESSSPVTAAVGKQSVLQYCVVLPAHRWLSFKIGLSGRFGNLESQKIEIWTSNPERLLETFEISGGGFTDKLISIPADAQKSGDNKLEFRFSKFAENPGYLKSAQDFNENPFPGVASYFSDFEFRLGNRLRPYKQRMPRHGNIFRLNEGNNTLTQLPNSEFSYAFELKPRACLLLSGAAESERKEPHTLSVTVSARTDDHPVWKSLWQSNIRVSDNTRPQSIDAEIRLEQWIGSPVEIKISTIDSAPYSRSRIVWNRMQLKFPSVNISKDLEASRPKFNKRDRIKNVVIIILDAARADHFGCYGNAAGMTPSIDAFARDSVVFQNAGAPAPYTLASVWSLFTGQHFTSTRIHGPDDVYSPLPEETLPKILRRNGYSTLAVSGNALLNKAWGPIRDFEHYFYVRAERNVGVMNSDMDMPTINRAIKKAACEEKPVFLFVHLLPPHWPYYPPEPFNSRFTESDEVVDLHARTWFISTQLEKGIEPYEIPELAYLQKCYMNNMLYADSLTQEILECLKQNDLFDESLIIITTDHGEAFGEHGQLEHARAVYEGLIRIPLIIRVPGSEHRVVHQQVGLIDIYPTIIEILDLDTSATRCVGRSIAPLLTGEDLKPGGYYYSRAGVNKLIFAMRGEQYKFISRHSRDELYDLRKDPLEKANIIHSYPVLAATIKQKGLMTTYLNRRRANQAEQELELSEEEERELRNLGYLQ